MPSESIARRCTPPVELAAARETALPFWSLMFFTFILFIAPQSFFPVLEPLRLAKLGGGVAIVAYVSDRLRQGEPLTVDVPPVRLILWFVVFAVLSIPFSRWPGGSMELLLNEFSKAVVIFFLLANTVTTVPRMRLMIWSLALWGVILSMTAIRAFAAGDLALQGVRIAGYGSPLAANPNDLALTVNLILALVIGLYFATSKLVPRLLLLAAMGLMTGAILVSFSRGGFLTLIGILGVLLIKRVREKGPRAVAPFVVLVPLALFVIPRGYGDRIYSIFDFRYDASGSATAREVGMGLSLNIMLENPLVGVGLGQDVLGWLEKGGGWGKTHNAFLQVGAELGIPAFLVYIFLMWEVLKAVRQSHKQLKRLPQGTELVALGNGIEIAVVGYVVGASFAPVPYHFYFYYVAGFAVAYHEMTKRFRHQHEMMS